MALALRSVPADAQVRRREHLREIRQWALVFGSPEATRRLFPTQQLAKRHGEQWGAGSSRGPDRVLRRLRVLSALRGAQAGTEITVFFDTC